VAELFEAGAQLAEVVDFAVEDDTGRAVGVIDGLLPTGQVNNRQPAHRQPRAPAEMRALLVGPAVADGGVHPGEHFPVSRAPVVIHNPYDAAHL
jgi:hypothetical protein